MRVALVGAGASSIGSPSRLEAAAAGAQSQTTWKRILWWKKNEREEEEWKVELKGNNILRLRLNENLDFSRIHTSEERL